MSVNLLAHEVHWGMHLFVEELRAKHNDCLSRFEVQEQYVEQLLPPLRHPAETLPHLAPARPHPTPP